MTTQKHVIQLAGEIGQKDSEIYRISVYNVQEDPSIASQVKTQFPHFVQEDHTRFVEFVEKYYEWMENRGNTLHYSHKIRDYQDIDTTIIDFTEQFFREFLPYIPRDIIVNKTQLLKHIKQFYRAKGTEKSFKLFFRILYNTNVDFYYPRVDILKVSDGKWIQNKTIRVFVTKGSGSNFQSRRVRGLKSNSSAFVERVLLVKEGSFSAYELVLNRSSVTGSFLPNETVVTQDDVFDPNDEQRLGREVAGIISPVPIEISIREQGAKFEIGQKFSINKEGIGCEIVVDDIDDTGGVTKMSIRKYGLGYNLKFPLTNIKLDSITSTTSAYIDMELGAVIDYPGYYLNEDGHISTTKYLHDGEYYQQFSYVLYVDESPARFKQALKQLIHPAGFKMFGGFRSQELIKARAKIEKLAGDLIQIMHSQIVNAKAKIHSMLVSRQDSFRGVYTSPLGPSRRSIYRDRYRYKPYPIRPELNIEPTSFWGNVDQEIPIGINRTEQYFGSRDNLTNQKAITPISVFGDRGLTPSNIEEELFQKTNILPDSVVRFESTKIKVEMVSFTETVSVGEYASVTFNAVNDTLDPCKVIVFANEHVQQTFDINSGSTPITWVSSQPAQLSDNKTVLNICIVDKHGSTYISDDLVMRVE